MSLTVPENLAVENQINLFFHNHSLGQLLRQSNVRKVRGISLDTLFQFLLSLAFTGKICSAFWILLTAQFRVFVKMPPIVY